MAEKILIVVDMQKDFVNGSLGSKDAEAIVPAVVKKAKEFDGDLIFTKDTHFENYMDTQEGHFLPVPHCMKGTDGRFSWSATLRCMRRSPSDVRS